MTDKFDVLADKLDNVNEKVSDINSKLEVHIARFDSHVEHEEHREVALQRHTNVLQANTDSLKDHMRRTDILETYVKKIDERFTPVEQEALRKKAVAEWWKNKVLFLAKLGGAIGALGAVASIFKWLLNAL
jgi:hypothetical protein